MGLQMDRHEHGWHLQQPHIDRLHLQLHLHATHPPAPHLSSVAQVRVGPGVVRRNIMRVALAVIGYAAGKRYKSICYIKREKSALNRF